MGCTPGTLFATVAGPGSIAFPLLSRFYMGFDWGFDGDLFATDAGFGRIMRVTVDGTATVFATLPGAADVAFRASEQALYVVSNQGGFYRIVRHSTADVSDATRDAAPLAVTPNPARGPCALLDSTQVAGLTRARVVDVADRL